MASGLVAGPLGVGCCVALDALGVGVVLLPSVGEATGKSLVEIHGKVRYTNVPPGHLGHRRSNSLNPSDWQISVLMAESKFYDLL